MKQTKEWIDHHPYPIRVTRSLPKWEHEGWIKHLTNKGIECELQPCGAGRYELWRKLTPEEQKRIDSGEEIIRNGQFSRNQRYDYLMVSQYLTVSEAARRLKCSNRMIYRLIDQGKLTGYRIGSVRGVRLEKKAVLAFMEHCKMDSSAMVG